MNVSTSREIPRRAANPLRVADDLRHRSHPVERQRGVDGLHLGSQERRRARRCRIVLRTSSAASAAGDDRKGR